MSVRTRNTSYQGNSRDREPAKNRGKTKSGGDDYPAGDLTPRTCSHSGATKSRVGPDADGKWSTEYSCSCGHSWTK